MKKYIKLGALILLFGTVTASFHGCKKKDLPVVVESVNEKVSVGQLKVYLGELITIDTSKIKYNEENEKFSVYGIEQIGREELIAMYIKKNNK
ncbi:hypothetical protein CA265_22750 [Sphingobacteriaceae bacterium GW460-11-11-14-LB5]|nr:hypothetical protein CA265_22750 [Sphingobacteriaceae bacterium GW460-11-11-14-LB5]